VSFKGAQEKILEEVLDLGIVRTKTLPNDTCHPPSPKLDLGIVRTKTEAIRVDMLNFALTSGLMSKEKILGAIHKQAKSIRVNEADLQGMIECAKAESIHR